MRVISLIIAILLTVCPVYGQSFNLSLTTYIPAPYGGYQNLFIAPQPSKTGTCQIGSIYVNQDDNNTLTYCGGIGSWNTISNLWAPNGDDVFLPDANSNLGVGVTSPPLFDSKLFVRNTTPGIPHTVKLEADDPKLVFKDTASSNNDWRLNWESATSFLKFQRFNSGTSSWDNKISISTNGNLIIDNGKIGIGNINPTHELDVGKNGSSTFRINNMTEADTNLGNIIFSQNESGVPVTRARLNVTRELATTDTSLEFNVNSIPALVLDGARENIGIKTLDPDENLHIVHDNNEGGTDLNGATIKLENTLTDSIAGRLQFYGNNGVSPYHQGTIHTDNQALPYGPTMNFTMGSNIGTANTTMVLTANRRVGIGTNSPDAQLHVNDNGVGGTIRLSRNAGGVLGLLEYRQGSLAVGDIFTETIGIPQAGMHFRTIDTGAVLQDRIFIALLTGNVGIGTTNPAVALDVIGDIQATGTITPSDEKFKKNFEPIRGSLDKIKQLNGLYFDWRHDEFPEKKFKDKRNIGLIAQDIEKVFPEVVQSSTEGFKSVNYASLTAPIVEAIKELAEENEHLKKRLEEQQKEIERLKTTINSM